MAFDFLMTLVNRFNQYNDNWNYSKPFLFIIKAKRLELCNLLFGLKLELKMHHFATNIACVQIIIIAGDPEVLT